MKSQSGNPTSHPLEAASDYKNREKYIIIEITKQREALKPNLESFKKGKLRLNGSKTIWPEDVASRP